MKRASDSIGTQPLHQLDATQAVAAMQCGEITAEGYATALLDKAAQWAHLNAFISLPRPMVLEAARAADVARSAGRELGLLHGLPIPVKDSINTAQMATTLGSGALRNARPSEDAPLVAALRRAGGIVMGKTNMTELAFGWTSHNSSFGAVRNPYAAGRIPGGSSGGSAAAVAAGVAPLSVGGDTLGSVRVPAALCGIAGLRPSFGRYRNDQCLALSPAHLDQAGPLARSVADLALFDTVMTGETGLLPGAAERLRIGIAPFHHAGLDGEVERITRQSYDTLRAAGVTLVEVELPEAMTAAFDISATLMLHGAMEGVGSYLRAHQPGLSLDDLLAQAGDEVRTLFQQVAMPPHRPTDEACQAMLARRDALVAGMHAHFVSYRLDALAFPAVAALPPVLGEHAEVEIQGRRVSFFDAFGRNTALSAASGAPGLVLPMGLSTGGLPVSLELVALRGMDRHLLSIGLAVEALLGRLPAPVLNPASTA